jgi:spore germination cell wall hydrolase CwlJ-like protein
LAHSAAPASPGSAGGGTQKEPRIKDAFLKLTPAQVLALTIYGEARGEPTADKIDVGSVILERVDHRDWDGKTIQEVCFKRKQFSCFNENDPNYGKLLNIAENWDAAMATNASLNECYGIAQGLIDGSIPRTPAIAAAHCCQYATAKGASDVSWDDGMKVVKRGKHHIFFA